MNANDLKRCYIRDIGSVIAELELYPDEAAIWALPEGVPNSSGTLALHLAGNLRHFIAAVLGGSGFVRDREAEFSRRDVPRAEMVRDLRLAQEEVGRTLDQLDLARLAAEYPLEIGGVRLPTGRFLIQLAIHLGYHLGQIDYHRRIVTGDRRGVNAVAPQGIA